MKKNLCSFLCGLYVFAFSANAHAQNHIITTIAGNSVPAPGYSGDGGAATAALMHSPASIGTDAAGNVYIADFGNHVVRKITSAGIISTFAGTGAPGYSGDGSAATAATLTGPTGIGVDPSGNVYIADISDNVIRMVNTAGIISTFAGTGAPGYSGDGFAATAAQINSAYGVTTDLLGNIYIADYGNNVIRKVNALGIISTYAGTGAIGYSGDGAAATAATLLSPTDVATDALGDLFVADNGNHVIRKIDILGNITTYAGNGTSGYTGDGGAATDATLNNPYGLAVDAAGNVYVADQDNNVIREINTSGIISTFAGSGSFGSLGDGGPATSALIAGPTDIAIDDSGNFYIADFYGNTVREITSDYSPVFIHGTPQFLSVCQDGGSINISPLFTVIDSDMTDTITWTVMTAPLHGALTGFADTVAATGDTVVPSGLMYTAAGGYAGLDSFVIQASDGVAFTTATVYVTVNPTPLVSSPAPVTACNGSVTDTIRFSGSDSTSTYTWTNSDTSIGLPGNGFGNIMPFTAMDTTSTPAVATITVTPAAHGCTGAPQSFTITVNPTPAVDSIANYAVCNGLVTDSLNFTSLVSGTTYTWANSNISIGLGESGTGNILPFTATDTTNTPSVATITVAPEANGCTGPARSFTITVNPTPTVDSIADQTACNGSTTATIFFTGSVTGTTYTWSNSDTSIGLSSFGGGNIMPFTATNSSSAPVTSVITVTPSEASCAGVSRSFSFTVNPTPFLNMTATAPGCDSTLFTFIPSSATAGSAFTWSRDTVTGISNPAISGSDTISEVLVNTTPNPIPVTYVYTITANGCSNTEDVIIVVNPKPVLSSPDSFAVCDSSLFSYAQASATAGTTYSWSRQAAAGISNAAASDTGNINEVLVNTTSSPILVTYTDTLMANGCTNVQMIKVMVNPRPTLSSTLAPAAICNNSTFSYTPTSNVAGATFSWVRPFVLGVALAAADGINNPDETLINSTSSDISVTYVYTIAANGCSYDQDVVVVVHPSFTLSSALTASACSGSPFSYRPSSIARDSSFTWTRANVSGITPSTGSGTGAISETLTSSSASPVNVTYTYIETAYGSCTDTARLVVTVNPQPAAPSITTHCPASLCTYTLYQNFGAATPPPAGIKYTWSATNAAISDTGSTQQYALVNFKTTGDAIVTLTASLDSLSCTSSTSFNVTVGTTVADSPAVVTYFNHSFVCLQNNETSYQWGYDNLSTLDSTLLPGEINQDYVNASPDYAHNNYWVMVTDNGCTQKTYFNKPSAATSRTEYTDVTIFPNPAANSINVAVNTTVSGEVQVELINTLGQRLYSGTTTNDKAQINLAGMAPGMYLVNCYREGVNISATRFIKN